MSLILNGCFHPEKVLYPESPVLVQEVKGNYALLYAYSKQDNSMKYYGWVSLKDFAGWTITKYDWNNYIGERNAE